jgi:hypothetical protein
MLAGLERDDSDGLEPIDIVAGSLLHLEVAQAELTSVGDCLVPLEPARLGHRQKDKT